MRIVLIGAGGGIGNALLRRCADMLPSTQIEATYLNRHPDINGGKVNWHQLDLTKEDQIETFSHQFEQVDWLINCVGILHCKHHGPEKSIRQLDSDFFMDNIKRNTLPTLLLAKYFQDKLMPNSTNPQTYAKLVTLSARVGSIGDNRLGGWYSYRASKTALNMAIKTLHLEWQRMNRDIAVMALHPGTTDTELSRPFQRNLPDGQLMSAEQGAEHLFTQIANLTLEDSGGFMDFKGRPIPW
ncbi:C-factor, putative [Vibrio ishigakensis]|uniref:C-factor, putative n=1 Tax=Vibrio ishigakensis TaxID=1481914 RepID=A0A0B8NRY6_9VIBR|nr:SDR family NAD(P)-dependent oxidoreductase [Vibrio ishigakensis]GAM56701.1 C-factor, putative [Vibrio ishigakensis]